jgi:4-hydroxy-tetrahydrodipicolinate synthase
MNKKKFRGVYTAIVTPFDEEGHIDWDAIKSLVETQIKKGVSGIVPCGTTGESPTLSHEEHDSVVEEVIKLVDGRCQVIAGAGSNCTKEAIRLAMHGEDCGADAVLVVNPYYNKPTQEGLYRHFKAVAGSIKIPLVIYNIKGRAGVNLETKTLVRIAESCPNVICVKEASGSIEQIREVISQTRDNFCVLSGDDGLTLELIKSGGDGIISVASNLIPGEMVEMVDAALNGDMKKAEQIDKKLRPIFEGEFIETNPIPIKAALAMKGLIKEVYRLPMCEMMPENREKWKGILKDTGVLE